MTTYKNGDRVRFITNNPYERKYFTKGPLLGTVVNASDAGYGDSISKIDWDRDVYPNHGKRPDMPYQYFELVERSPEFPTEVSGGLTSEQVDELRKHAVRGKLVPGAYRYVYGNLKQYNDVLVTSAHVDSGDKYGPQGTVAYQYISLHTNYFYGRENVGYLEDAGVIPRQQARTVTEVCDLGHEHTRQKEAVYNTNFLVPITLTGTPKV